MGGIEGKASRARLISLGLSSLTIVFAIWGCPDAGGVLDTLKKMEMPHAVTYDANGATSGNSPVDGGTYRMGATVTVLGNSGSLAKTGYEFTGWNTSADGGGSTFTQGQTFSMGSADITLFALWSMPTGLHSISGTVILSASGLPGVTVGAGSASAITDTQGHYVISGLPDGTYTVTPSLSGYSFTPPSRSTNVTGASVIEVNFEATPLVGSVLWDQAKWDVDKWEN